MMEKDISEGKVYGEIMSRCRKLESKLAEAAFLLSLGLYRYSICASIDLRVKIAGFSINKSLVVKSNV